MTNSFHCSKVGWWFQLSFSPCERQECCVRESEIISSKKEKDDFFKSSKCHSKVSLSKETATPFPGWGRKQKTHWEKWGKSVGLQNSPRKTHYELQADEYWKEGRKKAKVMFAKTLIDKLQSFRNNLFTDRWTLSRAQRTQFVYGRQDGACKESLLVSRTILPGGRQEKKKAKKE